MRYIQTSFRVLAERELRGGFTPARDDNNNKFFLAEVKASVVKNLRGLIK